MADRLKGGAFALACVSIALMLYTTQLPQYSDGAIATVMVFLAALAVYALTLVVAVPLAVRSIVRRETLVEARYLCFAIAAPLVVGAIAMLSNEALN